MESIPLLQLRELFLYLNETGDLRVNLHDASGLFTEGPLMLEHSLRIHDQPFCDAAKETAEGYRRCTRCKSVVCRQALRGRTSFFGNCPAGLRELVYPVIWEGRVICVLFLGGCVADREQCRNAIAALCAETGADADRLRLLADALPIANEERMLAAARLIEGTILLLLRAEPPRRPATRQTHWVVRQLTEYARENFRGQDTLRELAHLYGMNETYLGKLFERQTGQSFSRYRGRIRLEQAAELLRATDRSVLDISLECGFNSISYFNRAFGERYGCSPGLYRRKRSAAKL